MSVKITNMTNRPVMIRLNSGMILYLGGKNTSEEIIDAEVLNNHKLNRLQDRNIIGLTEFLIKNKISVNPKKTSSNKRKK